ncbi:MAG TPA: isoprenylcysteine carboxylmethyltransferase family protein [Candidatus Limnocylindria bacterium]|nr:isoprenylcysteine carboxylmethyltransferase family protein [Candidatus Limnocylindria bacterium]
MLSAQVAQRRAVPRRGDTVRTAGGFAAVVPYFFWVPYAVIALRPGPEIAVPDVLRWVGLAGGVAGVALSLWSIAALGRHYDLVLEVHADHELVRRGPYAVVRHPVYTGLAIHFAGLCLATGNLLLIAGTLLVSFPSFYLRARAEEELLRERFGAEYERYAREVPMLVPLL